MAIKELVDQAKKHPVIVVIALFACVVIGSFGSIFYIKVTEQRAGLLGDRITQLEINDKNQKKVNQIIMSQLQELRSGYQNLPESIKNVRKEFEYVSSLKVLEDSKQESLNSAINILSDELRNVENALIKSEAILNTFDKYLNANAAEANGKYTLAIQFYTEAAEVGNVDAQYRLGTLYARGLGVQQDLKDASYWYKQAAWSGNTGARAELAQLYLTGEGVELDKVKALALYKSLEKDVPLSVQDIIENISKELTPEQMQMAEKLSTEFTEMEFSNKQP